MRREGSRFKEIRRIPARCSGRRNNARSTASLAQMATVTALRPHADVPIATGNALELEGVSRYFGALRALEDVSFAVAAGERRAVIGANGAGKTTLFNVITGDFPATSGRVRFFGDDVTVLPPYERIRAGLRRTYQSSLLFRELTVRDNLFLAVRGVARGRFSLLRPRAQSTTRSFRRRPAATGPARRRRRRAGRRPFPRPTAAARDRHGTGWRAAADPVRRAGRRSFAGRTPRARRDS